MLDDIIYQSVGILEELALPTFDNVAQPVTSELAMPAMTNDNSLELLFGTGNSTLPLSWHPTSACGDAIYFSVSFFFNYLESIYLILICWSLSIPVVPHSLYCCRSVCIISVINGCSEIFGSAGYLFDYSISDYQFLNLLPPPSETARARNHETVVTFVLNITRYHFSFQPDAFGPYSEINLTSLAGRNGIKHVWDG